MNSLPLDLKDSARSTKLAFFLPDFCIDSTASLKYCVAFESWPGSSAPAGDVLKKLISSSAA
jgi:hypothetical protein